MALDAQIRVHPWKVSAPGVCGHRLEQGGPSSRVALTRHRGPCAAIESNAFTVGAANWLR